MKIDSAVVTSNQGPAFPVASIDSTMNYLKKEKVSTRYPETVFSIKL